MQKMILMKHNCKKSVELAGKPTVDKWIMLDKIEIFMMTYSEAHDTYKFEVGFAEGSINFFYDEKRDAVAALKQLVYALGGEASQVDEYNITTVNGKDSKGAQILDALNKLKELAD